MWRRVVVGAALAVLAYPATSWAGGYVLLPRGARNLGRGGAFVAGADDLSAAWLNPARLVSVRGVQALADVGVDWWDVSFRRTYEGEASGSGASQADNLAPPLASPSVFVGWDFGQSWLQVTAGVYGPYGGDLAFDSMGPQRYSLIYLDMLYINYQLAVAVRPLPWLALGAAFQIQDVRMTQGVKLSSYTGVDLLGGPETGMHDLRVEMTAASHFNPSGLLGVWIAPTEWFHWGLSVQLPTEVEATGTVTTWLPSDNPLMRDAWVDGDELTVKLTMPTIIRTGFALNLPHGIQVEVDSWVELWNSHRSIVTDVQGVVLRDVEGDMDVAMGEVVVPQDWRTSVGVAAGGEWEAWADRLTVRAGAFYDSGAIPDHTLTVQWVDSHKVGLCAGLSLAVWKLAFDVGYSHVFFVPREVNNSVVAQINPIEPADSELPTIVANGRYESSMDVLALTVRGAF